MTNPTLHDLLKGRLNIVRQDLNEAVARLKDEDLPYAPAKGMRTISGQLNEIIATEFQIQDLLQETTQKPFQQLDQAAQSTSVEEYKTKLHQTRQSTLDFFDSLTEQDLDKLLPVPQGWFESLTLPAVPKSEILRSLAAHEWYHTAQITSYLWTKGDNPYNW